MRYQASTGPSVRLGLAHELYARHLPLVKRTLARFCSQSRCYPGACLVEDLVGESYPVFQRSLDHYRSSRGVDFLGYVSQRLYWGLEHCARQLMRVLKPPPPAFEAPAPERGEEERLLDRVLAGDVLEELGEKDSELLARRAAGHSQHEIAESMGVSYVAVRKRLERLRRRLREKYA